MKLFCIHAKSVTYHNVHLIDIILTSNRCSSLVLATIDKVFRYGDTAKIYSMVLQIKSSDLNRLIVNLIESVGIHVQIKCTYKTIYK